MPYRRRITAHEKKIVAARQEWKCATCLQLLPSTFEVDHVVPLHNGGADDYQTNCHALCTSCHARKTQEEEVERLNRRHVGLQRNTRPPLECTRCASRISPYFLHRCNLTS